MMKKQITATVYIVEDHRVLLIFHNKLKKWLPPGGHLEPNEIPSEGARREAKEETGLDIEFITDEHVWVDRWNAKSFERPFMCMVEEIPAINGHEAHQHIDMIYLAKPAGGDLILNPNETEDCRWFALDELEKLAPDEDIFVETKEVIKTIFTLSFPKSNVSTIM